MDYAHLAGIYSRNVFRKCKSTVVLSETSLECKKWHVTQKSQIQSIGNCVKLPISQTLSSYVDNP